MDIVNTNRQNYEKFSDVVDEAQESYDQIGPVEDAWANIAPETEIDRIQSIAEREPVEPTEGEPDDIPDITVDTRATSVPMIDTISLSHLHLECFIQSLNEAQSAENGVNSVFVVRDQNHSFIL